MDRPRSHIAEEILRYLLKYPSAEDTAVGIAQWWLWRLRAASVEEVRTALVLLVRTGFLLKRRGIGQEPRYRLNPGKLDDIRSFFGTND